MPRSIPMIVMLGLMLTFTPLGAVLIQVDLSSNPAYQNQRAEVPIDPPGSGEDVRTHTFSLPVNNVGGHDYTFNFTLINVLTAGGLIERTVRLGAIANELELIYDPGLTAFGAGATIDASLAWNPGVGKDVGILRYIYIPSPESTSHAGEFNDGMTKFAGFRLVAGSDYYYGYLQLTIQDYPDHPSLSLAGYAYQSTANLGVTTSAIPEPATAVLWLGLAGLVITTWRRRARPR